MKTRSTTLENFLIPSIKLFIIVFSTVLLGCNSDDDNNRLLTDLEGIVLGTSGCSGVITVDVQGIGVVFAVVPPEFGSENTRIAFDMQLDEGILNGLVCNANVIGPSEVYRLTNVSLITITSQQ